MNHNPNAAPLLDGALELLGGDEDAAEPAARDTAAADDDWECCACAGGGCGLCDWSGLIRIDAARDAR